MNRQLADQAARDWASTLAISRWDEEKLRFWRAFHDERKRALEAIAKGNGYVLARAFIARCEEIGMPYTANAMRQWCVDKPYNNGSRE